MGKPSVRKMKAEKDIEGLIKALKNYDSREKATIALMELGKPSVVPLTEALKDEDMYVRQMAAVALRDLADKSAIRDKREVGPLIQALKDKDGGVRGTATEALTYMGKMAVGPLIQALRDEDKNVRLLTAIALAEIGDERAVEPLTLASKDKRRIVKKTEKKAS